MLRLLPRIVHIIHPLRHIVIDLRILINRIIVIRITINQVDATQLEALLVVFLETPLRYGPF